ncbi:uncharacterized protein N7479_003248 [Penicillium vulpinum]|uniref:Aminoglycoside phosphotransferase domain-containing protein n=1 Tax=Penicillium vulpinum TaxID=29845 RepID=A0A1V6S470_9EURO|nr:uncharacterized protein N7479_003248 [Penicillium vulpinum]KAJ5963372.1 hypothetical protein N7479_003248 [Penicillium vulpinum]OQE08519.1 hypothetical protein PENVUL_c009G04142 [Penicillium vulpinum]
MELQYLENENIPTEMPRDYTYNTVESCVMDILRVHDNRLRNQPNAANNVGDCIYQISALTAMRTLIPLFFRRNLCRGPFVLTLTDLNQNNIFVDDKWHITCLVDLEWACSRPIEMVEPPYWLTNQDVSHIEIDQFDVVRKEMMSVLKDEEKKTSSSILPTEVGRTPLLLSEVMEQAWKTGTFWYSLALSSPTGLFHLFYSHIQPLMSTDYSNEFRQTMPFYWRKDVAKFVLGKLVDKKKYDIELQQAFATRSFQRYPAY